MKASNNPLVSIVVPTRNSMEYFKSCLDSIKAQTYKNIELIVVDRDSTDGTKELARQYTDKVYNYGPERSAQVNYGASKASGKYIYKVDSDFLLDPAIVQQCVDKAAEGFDAVVVHNTPDERAGWLAKVRKFEIDMYKYSLANSAARFVTKDAYNAINGINEEITFAEDYDFQNRLTAHGFKTGFVDAEAIHLDEKGSLYSWLKKFYRYGKDAVNYTDHNTEKSKDQVGFIRSDYIKHWRRFFRHPLLAVSFIVYNFLKYGFGGLGYGAARLQARSK